jgi:ADP-ribosylglycohydrolase
MESKYIATVVLHALGDTIGFKNGDWEFNYFKEVITLDTTNELLYEFIDLGGINEINLENWHVSDDTIIHMAIMRGLLKSPRKFGSRVIINIKKELVKAYNQMVDDEEGGIDRMPGVTTNKYIEGFQKGYDGRNSPYDKSSGGNGAAMRCSCIGLAYHGEVNRDQLYEVSIESSRITHNSAIGYLGGLTVALFTSLAIEGINKEKWPFLLIDALTSESIKKYVHDDQDEKDDYEKYTNFWRKYVDLRFEGGKPVKSRANTNLIFRSRFQYENFTRDTGSFLIGESGYSATIMAYDSLLDAGDVWEKLIVYSALHFGDSDTVAAIACSWYGAIYGFGDVPDKNLKFLEFKGELTKLGAELYREYYPEGSK